jgi:hypothetical protein
MDEYTSHELAYQNGYSEGHEKDYKEGFLRGLEAGKPKWIPVTERLPEYRQIVAVRVHFPFDENARTAVTQYTQNYNPHFWERVTHWCELPEPPKGE